MAADDSTLDKPTVAAHIPLPRCTGWARDRVRPAHDPDNQIAALKSRPDRRFEHLTEPLVAQHQPRLALRRLSIDSLGDLAVSAAHAD